LKTAPEKRKDKLKNIAKRLIRKPDAYDRMLSDLKYSASQYGCSIHELHDPKLKYPEDFEW
jgi:pyoverdine/dityrosine biosynthesis protein Dit1